MKKFSSKEAVIIRQLSKCFTGNDFLNESYEKTIHSNLEKRMKECKFEQFYDYLLYLNRAPNELFSFVSALTIHTTFWMREESHFEEIVKDIVKKGIKRPKIWSVACSSGQEPFSLALYLEELREKGEIEDYEILASDVDILSIKKGKLSQYQLRDLENISPRFHRFLNIKAESFSPSNDIKNRVFFTFHNIFNNHSGALSLKKMDYILMRNVLIYFDQDSIAKIVSNLADYLKPSAQLVVGHCESLRSIRDSRFSLKGRSIYNFRPRENLEFTEKPKLLVVEDSPSIQVVIKKIVGREFDITLAPDTDYATRALKKNKFDVISLDLNLGKDCGDDWLLKERSRGLESPVIIVSDFQGRDAERVFSTLSSTSQDYLRKKDLNQSPQLFLEKLRGMVGNKIEKSPQNLTSKAHKLVTNFSSVEGILIGGSTGAIAVLDELFQNLPPNLPPIFLVQHMEFEFIKTYASNLRFGKKLWVNEVREKIQCQPGHIYLAGADSHLIVEKEENNLFANIQLGASVLGHRPSVDALFQSGARCNGQFLSILLTGMGRDGAQGMAELSQKKGNTNIIQDRESCVVFGMPGEALKLGAAHGEFSIQEIINIFNMISEKKEAA